MFRCVWCLCILFVVCSVSAANDWPQWRGPDRNGRADVKDFGTDWENSPPKLAWMVDGMGSGYASVSVKDGVLYTTGNQSGGQSVVAVNAADGKVLWTKSLTAANPKHGYDGSRCTPTIDGDRLYAVTSNGAIHCLKRDSGEVVWSKDFRKEWGGRMMSGWGFSESPLVDGDWVLCTPGGKDAMIVALDKTTGDEVWKAAMPAIGDNGKDGAGYSSIVVSNGGGVKQYVTTVGRGVIGVRAKDGKFLWGYNDVANRTANIPTPVVDGDYVFASTGYGQGSCLLELSSDGDGGVEAKEVYFLTGKQLQNHHGGMVKIGDYIYLGHNHNNGFPTCVEMKSGEVAWGRDKRGPGSGSAAVLNVNDHLIFRYQDGTVALIEATPKAYNLKGTFKPEFQQGKTWAHPVVVDGKLYLREQDKLMCYDVSG